jgi:L-amino acid N-acyltransferase YncA
MTTLSNQTMHIQKATVEDKKKMQSNMHTLILSSQDKKLGFISYEMHQQEQTHTKKTAEINHIYLKQEIRGHQLGKLLYQKALANLIQNNCNQIIAWVADSQQQAKRFYEAMGFTQTALLRTEIINQHVILRENQYQLIL